MREDEFNWEDEIANVLLDFRDWNRDQGAPSAGSSSEEFILASSIVNPDSAEAAPTQCVQ